MLNFCILASGSSGNCSVLWNESVAVLIDCGCSAKYIVENLASLGIEPCNLTAAVITHAHIDHISASGLNFLLKNNIPVHLHEDTLEDIFRKYGNKADECYSVSFNGGFKIKDIVVEPFNVYHKDERISRTLGFSFSSFVQGKKYKVGYVTDTGKVCKNMIKSLSDSNILVIESNYDREMLDSSFRPYENKRWVLSDWGHLANEDAAHAIAEIKAASTAPDSLKYVFLAHLSYHHNSPELALQVSKKMLYSQDINDVKLFAAKRKERCQAIKIK
ncbi:MAG: MBL fold metallo-hydrolase [Endomicrobium sp.]|jgi:phosphoribosyl 1,2-cyclic phosphodiesterase|nr:MBL fold metallo-hydrolase [Endomicrobium sp.]